MHEDIAKSLREQCVNMDCGNCNTCIKREAADAIDEMNRCLDGLEADNDSLCATINELRKQMTSREETPAPAKTNGDIYRSCTNEELAEKLVYEQISGAASLIKIAQGKEAEKEIAKILDKSKEILIQQKLEWLRKDAEI